MTDRQPERRWYCDGCQSYIDASHVQDYLASAFPGGDLPGEHLRTYAYSPSGGRQIGCYMRSEWCGPVKKVDVSLQEQFVEWCDG